MCRKKTTRRTVRPSTRHLDKQCLRQMFKDKNNCYSLREIATALLLFALLASWIAQQFFTRYIPEYMFWSFTSLVAAGVFGYSLEKGKQQ